MHTFIPVLTTAMGLVLMIGKMHADSEPGALPILLIVLGVGWYVMTRMQTRSHVTARRG